MPADTDAFMLIDPAALVGMTAGELVAMLEAMGRVVQQEAPKRANRIFREWGKLPSLHRDFPLQSPERHDPKA